MSQISKALKKVQESRQNNPVKLPGDVVFLTDAPKSWLKTVMMATIAVGTMTAILLSIEAINMNLKNSESKQIQILNLEKTIKAQEKRIDEFITAINRNQKATDNQIHDLNFNLKKESKDIGVQIYGLTSTDSASYDALKEAILDDKQHIESLENYTKTLDNKIEALSVANTQVNPSS